MKAINQFAVPQWRKPAILIVLALGLASTSVHAANTWDGGGLDGNWTTGDNWDDNSVPAFGNTADLAFTAASPVLTNSSIANDTTAILSRHFG